MELKVTVARTPTTEEEAVTSGVKEFVANSVELDQMPKAEKEEIEPNSSERSTSATSDVTNITKPVDSELTTDPYLFNDSGMLHTQEASFFSAFGTLCSVIPDHVQISFQSFARHSHVVTTFGSRLCE